MPACFREPAARWHVTLVRHEPLFARTGSPAAGLRGSVHPLHLRVEYQGLRRGRQAPGQRHFPQTRRRPVAARRLQSSRSSPRSISIRATLPWSTPPPATACCAFPSGGERWKILTGSDVTELLDVAVDRNDPGTIYFSHTAGIQVSHDRGATWQDAVFRPAPQVHRGAPRRFAPRRRAARRRRARHLPQRRRRKRPGGSPAPPASRCCTSNNRPTTLLLAGLHRRRRPF